MQQSELKKHKTKKSIEKKILEKKVNSIVAIIFTIIIISILFMFFYSLITKQIINTSIKNMEELSKHDEAAIMSGLENRWQTILGAATEIRQSRFKDTDSMLEELNIKAQTLKCYELVLLTQDGKSYSSNYTVTQYDEELVNICSDGKERFVLRNDNNEQLHAEGRKEILLMGCKINNFSIEENKFTYIACYYSIDELTDVLKIDSFNGKGYTSVIDLDGNFIVTVDKKTGFFQRHNFYESLKEAKITNNYTLEEIKQKVENNEFITLEYVLDDEERIMTLTPMNSLNWYLLMAIPREVLEVQSSNILRIVTILSIAVLLTIAVVVVLGFRSHSQRSTMELELKHKEELENALVLAEQANISKTTFLNNMSHDIRTPMNAIIGFTRLASTNITNTNKVKDYLEKIIQSSNHLLSLINDVLDMSRIESGKVTIDEKEENLADMIMGIKNIIQSNVEEKKLELIINTIDLLDEDIYCDKLRVNQVLLNLLSNAVKFTPEGGKIIFRVSEINVDKDNNATFEFYVKDNGIGMSPEFLKEVFEPFARERTSTVSGIQGTGLGMSIAKSIVDMMGGNIEVQSEVGIGTEFKVTLKFKLQDVKEKTEIINSLENTHTLIIDDDEATCKNLSNMLKQIGLNPEYYTNGKEALEKIKSLVNTEDEFKIFFVDWVMGEMDGIETTVKIRNIVSEDKPIIILSAYDWNDIEEEAISAGATGFINKPLFLSKVTKTLIDVYGTENQTLSDEKVNNDEYFKGRRILLVEDNMMNREIATEYLQDFGFLIETAENGKDACDKLADSAPGYYDLVLMDVQMPIMDGYTATRTIRQFHNKLLANIPIIAMTANAFEEDKKAAEEAGMNGHLAKPIDIAELLKTLKNILNGESER